jgi:glycosyltransferase involved in cell wall biosynthesis
MRRVLHLRSSAGIAGPERQIAELARELPRLGFELEVAILRRARSGETRRHSLIEELEIAGVPAWQIEDPGRSGIGAVRRLSRELETGRFAAVHSHDPKANWVSRFASPPAVPRIATVHLHTRATRALVWHARIDRWLLRRFDRIIAVAESAGRNLRGRRGIVPRLVPNGLDRRTLVERSRREVSSDRAGFDTSTSTILSAGRLVRQKGFDDLLEAFSLVSRRRPEVRLAVAGDGPEAPALQARARQLGVGEIVNWLGDRRDLPSLIARSRGFVLASRDEGAPYVLLEAMALGTPVIASAVGGVFDLLDGGAAGRLVPARSVGDLAAALVELLDRPEEARDRARRAAELVETRFSAARMAAETAEIYREVVA